MRILLLSHFFYPHLGGIETVSELLANQFFKAGHDIRVITWSKNTQADNFPYKVIRHPTIFTLIRYFFWSNIVLENNPCLRLSWPGFIIRKLNIVTLHIWLDHGSKRNSITQKLKLKKLALADKVVAVSNALKEKTFSSAVVIHDPYNNSIFKLDNKFKRNYDFVFVGRLVSDKGADYAIKAIHEFIKVKRNKACNFTKPLLTIIGDGTERKKLERLAKELELQDEIYFTGALQNTEIAKELNKHTFLLVPSLWEEPFGIVVLEGMACGCIPIIANSGGLPEAAGDDAVIFENKNLKAFVNAINLIVNDPELQIRCKQAATTHLKLHTAESIANKYLMLMQEIINK